MMTKYELTPKILKSAAKCQKSQSHAAKIQLKVCRELCRGIRMIFIRMKSDSTVSEGPGLIGRSI